MNDTIVKQVKNEILRREKENSSLTLPSDYERVSAMYAELLEQGITHKRESLLRSISDPPITLKDIPYFAVQQK